MAQSAPRKPKDSRELEREREKGEIDDERTEID